MLGKRLKELRGPKTQEDIAISLGLSRPRYSHYENERSYPDPETLIKIADHYHVSTDYLLGRTNNKYPDDEFDIPQLHEITSISTSGESTIAMEKIVDELKRSKLTVEGNNVPNNQQKILIAQLEAIFSKLKNQDKKSCDI